MSGHYAQEPTLTGVLTSLFLVRPPTLLSEQLSENLRMRHRLLGIPSTPPVAYELDGADLHSLPAHQSDYAIPAEEKKQSRLNFASWLITNLGDNDKGPGLIEGVARSLFKIRDSLHRLQTRRSVEQDVVYAKLCSTAWHQPQGKRLVLLQFPINKQHALTLTLSRSTDGAIRFENITHENPLDRDGTPTPETLSQVGLHFWTPACDAPRRDEEPDNGAEYISNPNDFWDGYEEQDDTPQAAAEPNASAAQDNDDDYWNSYGQQAQDEDPTPLPRTLAKVSVQLPDQSLSETTSNAVKDVIRGALSLYKSTHPSHNKHQFLALVTQTLEETA